ncbi:MAG: LPS assembly lipoprotein LptE [Phycisphaerales bacterium]
MKKNKCISYKSQVISHKLQVISILLFLCPCALVFFLAGCSGYTNQSLYSEEIRSVYVEMFDNTTYRRDLEYDLTDAIAKRIETDTPYKVVSNRSTADTIISGKIIDETSSSLTVDRDTGKSIENRAVVSAQFNWKNLKTGQYLVENRTISATSSYSPFLSQSFENSAKVAANKLAERIVEQMQVEW